MKSRNNTSKRSRRRHSPQSKATLWIFDFEKKNYRKVLRETADVFVSLGFGRYANRREVKA